MIDIARSKEIFVALSLHFKQDGYDYFKYNGRLKNNIQHKPNEFWFGKFAARLQTEEKIIQFYVANFIEGYTNNNRVETFARNFCHKENFNTYRAWIARMNSLQYNFKKELGGHDLKELIEIKDGQHPKLYSMYLGKQVTLETICCLAICMPKLLEYWKQNSADPVLLPEFCKFVEKYRPFFSIDRDKFLSILQESKVESN